ncbi:MAG: hypothetical protein Q9192_004648, partial [Flavoplaca navasiana]
AEDDAIGHYCENGNGEDSSISVDALRLDEAHPCGANGTTFEDDGEDIGDSESKHEYTDSPKDGVKASLGKDPSVE